MASSRSLAQLRERLKDIDQLLKAHTAITKFNNAEKAAKQAGGQLASVSQVVHALVANPGKGRPKQVDAINRAGFVLLIAHFQGFIDELHQEIGRARLKGKAADPDAVIQLVRPPRSNPHVHVIDQMFAGIGIYDLMDGIRWQKCANKKVKTRLKNYIETRNRIVHGSKESIRKARVVQLKQFIELLAEHIDEEVRA